MEKRTKTVRIQNPGWLFYLTSKLTNHQKYYMMIIIVISAFFMVIWGILRITSGMLAEINDEIQVSRLIRPYRMLYEHVDQHRSYMQLYRGNERVVRSDIRRLETLIQQDLEQLAEYDNRLNEFYEIHGNTTLPEKASDLETVWRMIVQDNQQGDSEKAKPRYESFLTALSSAMQNLESSANPDNELLIGRSLLGEISNREIPKLIQAERLEKSVDVTYFLNRIKHLSKQYLIEVKDEEAKSSFAKSFGSFERAYGKAERGEEAIESLENFQRDVQEQMDALLQKSLSIYEPREYILLVASIITLITGILIGKFFVDRTVDSVRLLHYGYNRLNKGDLSVRIPIFFDDEIGRATIGFNLMAEELDYLISKQRALLEATKRLASGDFTTRVAEDQREGESSVAPLVQAFNHLAENFDQIMSRVSRLGIQLDLSSNEVSDASRRYEDSTANQEKTTQRILQTSIEISSNAREYSLAMSEVTQVVEQAAMLASKNQDQLKKMAMIMQEMVDASNDIAGKLGILNDKTANINAVLTTIIEVADQTNLLSLNAAITAEKAERFGESFIVIASEIRSLAEMTAEATLEIETIISEMMRAVSESVMGVDDFIQEIQGGARHSSKVASQLEKIIEEVQKLVPRFEFVNDGMKIQSDASRLIHESIAKLSKKAHLTTESMHQFVLISTELKESASYLNQTTAKMTEKERGGEG